MKARTAPNGSLYLNVGCGSHFSPDWNNLDLHACPGVTAHDVRHALPFEDAVFDVVYSSHVLEHLTPSQGEFFLREHYRVLKPGGICRVVVPDLERICRDYLEQLERGRRDPGALNRVNYDWGVLQLIDQMVREEPGGEMMKALRENHFDPAFVQSHFGEEFADCIRDIQQPGPSVRRSFLSRVKNRIKRSLPWIPKPDARNQGEAHRWMYDSFSLGQLLVKAGFSHCAVTTHNDSQIPAWGKYRLDSAPTGTGPRKPDSLFVEARK